MKGNIEKNLVYLFFTLFIILQVFFILFSDSAYGYGGADNITHYQIARYALKHPLLFLDLWGKPVYTILSAPFALIGFNAAKTFNLFVAVLTLILTAKISAKLFHGSSVFALVLGAFSPVYFLLAGSCMTEVLFSFVLVAAVWFFLNNRLLLSAVVLSFLPFVRSEGIVILPVFTLAFLLQRRFLPIVLLMTGALIFTIIGYFVFNDILWVINRQPYSLDASFYGRGSFTHFVENSHSIFGIPLLVLIIGGLLSWIYQVVKKFSLKSTDTILFIVIVGSWLTFFAAHSYVWWKGTGASLGLTRVMGSIIPLAVLTGMKAFQLLSEKVKRKQLLYGIFSVFAILQIILLFTQNNLLLKADPTEQLIKKSTDYLRFNEEGKKVYYFNPLVVHYLNLDPYNTKQCNWWVADRQQPSNTLDWGDLLVWDAHFGPNEGGVQLETLEKDPYLKKIKSFYPVEKVTVLGGYDYSVQIYKKSPNKGDTIVVTDEFKHILSFEENIDPRVKLIDSVKAWEIDSLQEYGPNIVVSPDAVRRYEILEYTITLSYKTLQPVIGSDVMLVFSAENEGKSYRYEKADLTTTESEWRNLQLKVRMSAAIPDSSRIIIYVWNLKKKHLLIQKMMVEVKSY